jgi:hypothetical protein
MKTYLSSALIAAFGILNAAAETCEFEGYLDGTLVQVEVELAYPRSPRMQGNEILELDGGETLGRYRFKLRDVHYLGMSKGYDFYSVADQRTKMTENAVLSLEAYSSGSPRNPGEVLLERIRILAGERSDTFRAVHRNECVLRWTSDELPSAKANPDESTEERDEPTPRSRERGHPCEARGKGPCKV